MDQPPALPLAPKTIAAAFLERCLLDPDTGCWLWRGKLSHRRAPVFLYHGHAFSACRFAWELFRGPPPKDGRLLRVCSNPRCVRPDHLRTAVPTKRARQSPFKRLSPEAVLDIRTSRDSKRTLARRYDVSEWTVWAVRSGRRGKLVSFEPAPDPAQLRALELRDLIERTSALLASYDPLQTKPAPSPEPYREATEQRTSLEDEAMLGHAHREG